MIHMRSRSPGHRVPWWVLIWIKRSPLVFLVLSVACFSMGLVLFAYSSGQSRITSTVTTVFSACSCFGLTAVSCWFAFERWIFNRHKGQKWLADVISETRVRMNRLPAIAWCIQEPRNAARKVAYWSRQQYHTVSDEIIRVMRVVSDMLNKFKWRRRTDLEASVDSESKSPVTQCYSPEPLSAVSTHRPSNATFLGPISEAGTSTYDGLEDQTVVSDNGTPAPASPVVGVSPPKARLRNLVRSVIMLNTASNAASAFNAVAKPSRKRTMSSENSRNGRPAEIAPGLLRSSRVAALVPKLKRMEATQDLAAHQALVRHLQFSPNGKFLATSR